VDRRDLIKFLALSPGSAIGLNLANSLEAFAASSLLEQHETIREHSLLGADEYEILSIAVDLIIPPTDTPGAAEAGVPEFADLIISSWYTDDEREVFIDGLRGLDQFCVSQNGEKFVRTSVENQIAALQQFERKAQASQPMRPTDVFAMPSEGVPFFFRLKELTVLGYYTSEIGSTQELKYNPVPGHYDGDVDFDTLGRQWSD
jgi:hypothetical protein